LYKAIFYWDIETIYKQLFCESKDSFCVSQKERENLIKKGITKEVKGEKRRDC